MRPFLLLLLIFFLPPLLRAEPDFPLTGDSKPNPDVPKGELIKASHTTKEGSVFPGTERDYTLYLPAGFDKTKAAPFMVFQDGVIYQAPTVFDNLIARKEIPPLVGVFVKPGVVPAANENALPRFNRSYEYDSVTATYASFLIEELLPTIEQKHGIKFSTDPNDAAISGNSSGGIAAFMVAWHRPDRFRRVFTGVGTYVGIRGADQLPVLIRKIEPKPIKVFLQSGTGDNNLYCGDWWMANQMMERSLTWAGYEVNHAWGEGGHNQKHASQIFPDVLRWLWKGWPESKEVKANPRGESKWKGYEVCVEGARWEKAASWEKLNPGHQGVFWAPNARPFNLLAANIQGEVFSSDNFRFDVIKISVAGNVTSIAKNLPGVTSMAIAPDGLLWVSRTVVGENGSAGHELLSIDASGNIAPVARDLHLPIGSICISDRGACYVTNAGVWRITDERRMELLTDNQKGDVRGPVAGPSRCIVLSPDGTALYSTEHRSHFVRSFQVRSHRRLAASQLFYQLQCSLEGGTNAEGLCVDTDGRLYVATSLGIQVCDQAGRVNFIIPTPQQPFDVCFGGKDLSELFIACGDKIYKRQTKVHGIVSGQMAPIKPAPPKL